MSISALEEKVSSTNIQSVQQLSSSNETGEKISSIGALTIDLIGNKIIEAVMKNLGPVGKARVAEKVKEIKETHENPMDIVRQLTMVDAEMNTDKEGDRFLSNESGFNFLTIALSPVKKEIADAFSMPSHFLESGLYFQVSEYWPTGFVSEAAQLINIAITSHDIPIKYVVCLKLNEELTQKNSDIAFSLTETSEGVEFSKKTFTIVDLEQEFHSNL